jgi:CYTH domain-containing protein
MMEIERKFVLPRLPTEIQSITPLTIIQGYAITEPGELRLREEGGVNFVMTVKDDGDLARQEWSASVPRWVFEVLWRKTEGRRIRKLRRLVKHHDLTLEVDEYMGELAGLFVLEVEFPTEAAAAEFEPPWWARDARDVTHISAYKNKRLAVYGAPTGL